MGDILRGLLLPIKLRLERFAFKGLGYDGAYRAEMGE